MLRSLLRWWHARVTVVSPTGSGFDRASRKPKVLILGVYLADRRNTVVHLVGAFSRSAQFDVTQRWVAIAGEPPDAAVAAVTVERLQGVAPKFAILNRMLAQSAWQGFDYLLFCDDDIVVPRGFFDAFLGYQIFCDFALAQPARTRSSYADRKFARAVRGIRARRTRFVEIGPLVSVRSDFAPRILPFDESSPMGWGYDFVWPVLAEAAGLRLGIVDATPVDHSLRDQASAYSSQEASRAMIAYLERTPHLKKQDAFTVLQTY
jgi:hypothetical protein